MIRALPFTLAYLVPATVVAGGALGGGWTFLTVAFVFGLIPAVDALAGVSRANPDAPAQATLLRNPWYRWLTIAYVPVQLGVLAWALARAARTPSTLEAVGLTLSLGILCGGVGITVAHELMHRPGRAERALAELLMLVVTYPHFCVEHILGHHRNVATPADAASARFGEPLYAFLPRSIVGGFRSAVRLEAARVRRARRSPWSPANRFWRYGVELAALYAGVALWIGGRGVVLFAAQGVLAFGMLEVINYIEHYGLARREVAPGRYERTDVVHSWNASERVGNWFLFNLQRHSDHHYLAARPYQVLRHFEESPQLPTGYAGMFLVALVPPLWFRVMNCRAERARERVAARAEHPTAEAAEGP